MYGLLPICSPPVFAYHNMHILRKPEPCLGCAKECDYKGQAQCVSSAGPEVVECQSTKCVAQGFDNIHVFQWTGSSALSLMSLFKSLSSLACTELSKLPSQNLTNNLAQG